MTKAQRMLAKMKVTESYMLPFAGHAYGCGALDKELCTCDLGWLEQLYSLQDRRSERQSITEVVGLTDEEQSYPL